MAGLNKVVKAALEIMLKVSHFKTEMDGVWSNVEGCVYVKDGSGPPRQIAGFCKKIAADSLAPPVFCGATPKEAASS